MKYTVQARERKERTMTTVETQALRKGDHVECEGQIITVRRVKRLGLIGWCILGRIADPNAPDLWYPAWISRRVTETV